MEPKVGVSAYFSETAKRPFDETTACQQDADNNKRQKIGSCVNFNRLREQRNTPVSTTIDDLFSAVFKRELDAALKPIAKKLGLMNIEIGKITPNDTSLSVTLSATAVVVSDDGTPLSKEQIRWNENCHKYGFAPQDWGKKFILKTDNEYNDQECKVYTIHKRNSKYPLYVVTSGGILLKLTSDDLHEQLKTTQFGNRINNNNNGDVSSGNESV